MGFRRPPAAGRALLLFRALAEDRDVDGLVVLLNGEEGQSPKLRAGIVDALGETRVLEAVAPVAAVLADRGEDRDVRLMAARALGTLGDHAAVPVLLDALSEDWLPMRVRTTVSLGQIGGPQATDALLPVMQSESATLRSFAADALAASPTPAATAVLVAALRDPTRKVRLAAAKALAEIGDPDALEALREAAQREGRLTRGIMTESAERLGRRIANEGSGRARPDRP